MPTGRTPKPADQRRNRHKPVVDEVKLDPGAKAKAPPVLPGGPWRDEVLAWYRAWTETPASAQFSTTEWERLHRAAPLCEAYWLAVEWAAQGRWVEDAKGIARLVVDYREVRDAHAALLNAEKGLPATDYDRRRNGIQLKAEPAPTPTASGEPRLRVV